MNKKAVSIDSLEKNNILKLKGKEEYFPILDLIKICNEIASISCYGFVVDKRVITRMFETDMTNNIYIYRE